MRRMRQGLGLLLTIGLGLFGCAGRDIALRPPKHPDEIVVPPEADGKFRDPPRYPDASNPNNDSERAANGGGGGQPNVGAMNMGGMGGGMGGMGMGGMGSGSMLGGYGR